MKPINALIVAVLGGLATFAAQNTYFPPQAHAAAFVVPTGPDWRRQMLEHDPGSAVVDKMLSHLTAKLDLSAEQADRIRPLLQQRHERILALLLTAPPSLTRDQFVATRRAVADRTREQVDTLLTQNQLELAKELREPMRG